MDGRADGDAPPLDDAPVDVGGDLADLRLRAEPADLLGQLLDLPPQPQRRRQELVRLHAFPARVVADPGVPVVAASRLQVERPALARQVIEHAPLLGIGDLLVDPRRERRPPRLPLSHLPIIVNAPCGASCCYPKTMATAIT